MWAKEKDFQSHLVRLLEKTHVDIEEEFFPFDFINLSVDIKATFNEIEEWRELKLIIYQDKGRSIQNLWKGIGKVLIMRKLRKSHLSEQLGDNILSLPSDDFNSIAQEIQNVITELVKIELVNQSDYKFVE
ncbi:MAG: hypothetical protein INQ03_21915 [Candidatus Heimdallarchaeota archaeon]|nr:hypothetical protein [Candidatus Heimdallarchaeota archaeon]